MRKIFIYLSLVGLLGAINQTSAQARTFSEIPVEVVRVKDLGLSDRDESKSVIEVEWRVNPAQKEKIVSFNLVLFVTYADGTTIIEKRNVEKKLFSVRVEVPSVKTFAGRPSAFIKKLNAKVTAIFSKN
jgi:hypothetical protein